jgi:hypothetical protein
MMFMSIIVMCTYVYGGCGRCDHAGTDKIRCSIEQRKWEMYRRLRAAKRVVALLKWPGEDVRQVSEKIVHAGGITRDGRAGMVQDAWVYAACIH